MEQNSERQGRENNTGMIIGIVVLVVLCLCAIMGSIGVAAYFFLGVSVPVGMSPPAVATVVVQVVPLSTPTPVDTPAATDEGLVGQIESGQITLDAIKVSEPGQTIGPVLAVEVTNPGDEETTITVPCGLIFMSNNRSEQRLMVIQETSAVVSADSSSSVEAEVACIDSGQYSPSGDADYTIGEKADGDLLTLATCLCQRELNVGDDPFGGMGTQFAVWAVSDGVDLDAMRGGVDPSTGAMGSLFTGELGELMEQLLGPAIDEAETILTECGVSN